MNKIISTLGLFAFLTFIGLFTTCKDTNSRQTGKVEIKDSISTTKSNNTPIPNKVKLYAWVDQLRVRASADKTSAIVEEVAEGGQLTFLEEKSDFTEKINLRGTLFDEPWLKVETANGKIGWVYGGGVKFYAPVVDQASSPYDDCMELYRDEKGEKAYACVQKTKAQELKANSRWVKETEEGVFITLLDGSKASFKSKDLSMEENNLLYEYRFYIPQMGYHVLRIIGYEWSGYLLVNDKSGKSIEIYGYPKASPDFRHLVFTNIDLEAGFEFNGLGLMGFTENGLEKIFDRELDNYGPVTPIWLDNNKVEITFLPREGDPEREKKKVQLIQGADGEWTLMD